MHRFTNDLSSYAAALDMTRDGKTLAAIQLTRVSDIWTAPAGDSSQSRQITSGEQIYTAIVPGPAGKVLASSANGDLWLMKLDGSERATVVPQAGNLLSLSSCGDRYLLYDRYVGGKIELWRADADGANAERILDEVEYSDCSPDGSTIFYAIKDRIYHMPVDGGAPVEVMAVPGTPRAWLIRVSPDGQQFAFLYQEGDPIPVVKVAVESIQGGIPQFTHRLPIGYERLRWAPSGKAIQYLLTRNGATNVWEQPLSDAEPRQITSFTSGRIFDFAWSRDGKQLLLAKGSQSSDVILIRNFR